MHQPVLRLSPRPSRTLAALAVLAVLALLAPAAADAAEPRMDLPRTTVFHVHLLQAGGTVPPAPGAARALPAAVQRAAGALAPPAGEPPILLGSAVLATSDRAQTRIAGPGGVAADLTIDTSGRSADGVDVRRLQVAASLQENRRPELLLDTSATLPLGEAMVAGTSYLGPELGTLIVVVEARAAEGAAADR